METSDLSLNPERKEREFQPWGDTTDPKKHNPNKFRYLVHGFNPFAKSSMGLAGAIVEQNQSNLDNSEGDPTIDLLQHPEQLAARVALSCSLIDEAHYGTWGRGGIIVEAPIGSVVITKPSDAGALVMNRGLLEEQAQRNPIFSADQLLEQTPSGSYNEVVVLANNKGQKVHLAGFFIKVVDGVPIDEYLAGELSMHATRLKLPLVKIAEPSPYKEDRIIRHKSGELSVIFQGKMYYLVGPEQSRFRNHRPDSFGSFSSPDEIKNVLQFLVEQGVDKGEIKQILKDYSLVDKKRQQPKVYFGDDGRVVRIEKSDGYGTNETKFSISRSGAVKWNNLELARETYKTLYSDNQLSSTGSRLNQIPLSKTEVEGIFNDALAGATDKERTEIKVLYELIKDSVALNSQSPKSSGMVKRPVIYDKNFIAEVNEKVNPMGLSDFTKRLKIPFKIYDKKPGSE